MASSAIRLRLIFRGPDQPFKGCQPSLCQLPNRIRIPSPDPTCGIKLSVPMFWRNRPRSAACPDQRRGQGRPRCLRRQNGHKRRGLAKAMTGSAYRFATGAAPPTGHANSRKVHAAGLTAPCGLDVGSRALVVQAWSAHGGMRFGTGSFAPRRPSDRHQTRLASAKLRPDHLCQ